MKKIYTRNSLVSLLLLFYVSAIWAQSATWSNKFEAQKVFIQNKGQFSIKPVSGFSSQVKYAYDGREQNFYFTSSGVVIALADYKKPKEKENEEREMRERMKKGMTAAEHAKMEAEENRMIATRDQLTAQWVGANPNVQIIADDEISATYSYCFNDKNGKLVNESAIPAFRKLTYKNLYPNIDVVYEMHKDIGLKYSVIVHPGGDVSLVKMQYSKNARLISGGDIKTHTRFGNIVDHAPVTFYEDSKTPIASVYTLKNNVISFSLADHDATKTVVIDPWTQTPSFSTAWHTVWECDKDASGNVYIIGGIMPMQLLKYNSGGTLQWTYNTPYDTSNGWLGTFAVDNAGNSYVTKGSDAQMQKIDNTGALQHSNNGSLGSVREYWSISFNCDQTQLVVGGTDGNALSLGPYIFNIDPNTLGLLNSAQVTGSGSIFGFPPRIQEVRAITASGNGNYYFLTHDSIGYIHQGLATCLPPGSSFPFHVDNGLALGYKCEDFRVNNTGISAIKSFGGYVFTHKGNQVQKRNFYTGAVIATAAIPGGAFPNSGFGGGNYVQNSGIDIDSCGNVYCGSTNGVVKYDINLNQLATFATSFIVYDVNVTSTGDLIAVGSTGNSNSGSRTGYVQSFAAAACKVIRVVCCDAFICPHAAVCTTNPAFNFTSVTAGGVWSGTGITNATNGTFNPATAGVGTFTIYYTLPCGRDSTRITVNNCSAVSLCNNGNGTLTVSGGTAPYTWQVWDSTGRNCVGGFVIGTICVGGTWVNTYGWRTFSTGAPLTVTYPAGTDTLRVIDNAGTTVTSYNIATLPPCNACNLVVTAGPKRNVSCLGGTNGSAHVTTTGGTAPLTYTWSPNVSTVDSASNLVAGTYTVTVRDNGGCSGTATFSITQPATGLSASVAVNQPATCGNNNGKIRITVTGGTPAYTYAWSPNVSTVDSAANLAAGLYHVTVTDQGGCTAVLNITVATGAGITVTAGTTTNVSCFGGNNGVAHVNTTGGTTPYTYTWSPNVSTVDSAVNLTAGTYTVTVHDANNCAGSVSFTITQPAAALAVTNTATQPTCNSSNGRIVLHVTGGTAAYTYTWAPNVSTVDSALNLAAGTYSVTVRDARGCTVAASITISLVPSVSVSAGAQTNVSCFGGNNGVAHVIATGGATPYTYAWSPNVSTVDSAVLLTAGTYTVTVRDANNCPGTATFTITQPAAPLAVTNVTVPATCGSSNGKIVLSVSGGTPQYTYIWSPNVSTVDSAINLGIGTYNVTITDSKECTLTTSVSVASSSGFAVSAGPQVDVNCFGGNTGAAHVVVVGGTTPYTYTWSPNVSTNDSAVNLTAGTYSVTIHDAGACSGVITFNITQPAGALSATAVTAQGACGVNNGSIHVTAAGGTPGYAYGWTPSVSTTDSAVNLGAGAYTVTVTDNKGCTVSLTRNITVSPAVTLSAGAITDVSCFGGSTGAAHVTAGGGTGPFGYTWSPNVSTTDSAINIAAGAYAITVTDANTCTAAININIQQPTALAIVMTEQNTDCGVSNGWAHAAVSGGTLPYRYQWSNLATSDSATGLIGGTYRVTVTDANGCIKVDSIAVGTNGGPAAPTISGGPLTFCLGDSVVLTSSAATGNTWSNTATTQSITVYNGGTYTVTQTAGGCTSPAASVTVTVNPIPSTPTIAVSGPLALCPGQSVILTSSASTGNVWSTTATTQSITVTAGGSYTVTVILAGCPGFPSAPVVVTNLPSPTPAITASASAVCPGDSVTLDATTAGATAYVWNTSSILPVIRTVSGVYTVTVTVNGCPGSDTIDITTLPVLGSLILNDSFLVCVGDTVTLDATTSNAGAYHWTGNGIDATTPVITVLADSANPQGTYNVDVTNSCGALSDAVTVTFQGCDCKMIMGNAFSPNGDGKNELYGPVFLCNEPKSLTMHIYNRWGQKVFDSDELGGKWDGRYKGEMQPDGVYTYFIEFVGMERHKEKTFKMSGNVTLIR